MRGFPFLIEKVILESGHTKYSFNLVASTFLEKRKNNFILFYSIPLCVI